MLLETVIGAMLTARATLWGEFTKLYREMLKIARADRICYRLMSTPGVGALVALTYRSAVDDPTQFSKSSTVGAYFGLPPKKYQSGETDRDGGVSKVGDAMVRTVPSGPSRGMPHRRSATRRSPEARVPRQFSSAVYASASRRPSCRGDAGPVGSLSRVFPRVMES